MKVIKLKFTQCYFIPVGEKYLLIDTGYDWEQKEFDRQLDNLNINFTDIMYLLITHHHDDHTGLINHLVDKHPAIKVIASRLCFSYLKEGKHVHPQVFGHTTKRIHYALALKGCFDKKWTHSFPNYIKRAVDVEVDSEMSFIALNIPIDGRIIFTPGHAADQISVVLANGDCFCGDAASNFLHFAGLKNALISIDDWDAFYDSWDKLIASSVRTVYPAHGKPFGIEQLKKNLRKCLKKNMVLIS